jgi:hypothetical protein
MTGVTFPFVLPSAGIKTFNDPRLDNAQAVTSVNSKGFGLPILPNTSAFTDYPETGWLAYDKANSVPMFSNGVDWTDLSSSGGIVTNSSLVGNGTTGSPLGVAPQSVTPGTYYNPILVINGDGIVTSATNTNTLIADWMTTATVTGSGATSIITAAALDSGYNNATPVANLNATTGVYTCTQPGYYTVSASVNSTSVGSGDFINNVAVLLTNGLASGKTVGWNNQATLSDLSGAAPQFDVSVVVPLAAGNTVWTTVTTSGTASSVTYSAHVTMAYFNGPFV